MHQRKYFLLIRSPTFVVQAKSQSIDFRRPLQVQPKRAQKGNKYVQMKTAKEEALQIDKHETSKPS